MLSDWSSSPRKLASSSNVKVRVDAAPAVPSIAMDPAELFLYCYLCVYCIVFIIAVWLAGLDPMWRRRTKLDIINLISSQVSRQHAMAIAVVLLEDTVRISGRAFSLGAAIAFKEAAQYFVTLQSLTVASQGTETNGVI